MLKYWLRVEEEGLQILQNVQLSSRRCCRAATRCGAICLHAFLDLLSGIGRPKVIILANAVRPLSPDMTRWILEVPWLSSALAITLTLLMLYLLG